MLDLRRRKGPIFRLAGVMSKAEFLVLNDPNNFEPIAKGLLPGHRRPLVHVRSIM